MRIFHVIWSFLVLVLVVGLGMTMASAANGADVLTVTVLNGEVVNPNDFFEEIPEIAGTVSGDTERVTVAIKNRGDGTWWNPDPTCIPSDNCFEGTFGSWVKSETRLALLNDGRKRYSFTADLPDGDYNLGVKAYDAAGSTGQVVWQQFSVATSEPDNDFPDQGEFGAPLSVTSSSPAAGEQQNAGAVAFTGGYSGASQILVGVYNRDLGKWMDPDGNALPSKQRFPAALQERDGFTVFTSTYRLTMALPAGSYAYGVDAVDFDGASVGSLWTGFTVAACEQQCANGITLDTHGDGTVFQSDDVCFSVGSNAANISLQVRNDDTGQWLQNTFPPTLGDGEASFNNLSTLIQAGINSYNSCYNDPPISLPVGNYHYGVTTQDEVGNAGPSTWISFTVVP